MKIGILGGTFDPPHIGHLGIAQAAIEQLGLDEVMFLPANKNPLKATKASAAGKHRLGMIEALIRDEEKMAVSDMELTRGGVSYTVDTLGELLIVNPAEYWFLLGADSLKGLPDWKSPQRLLKLARIGVVIRPPTSEADAIARIPEEFRDRIDIVNMAPIDTSSTDLRNRLRKRQSVSPWITPNVLKYIATYRLYSE